MKRKWIIGVMGGGSADQADLADAYRLGALIAQNDWILLNGGRNSGIMEASARGAAAHGGLTIGIIPDDTPARASRFIDIPVITGMGSARNCINVLTSDVVVACPGGAGTLSEIALALKYNKKVILLSYPRDGCFESVGGTGCLTYADTPDEVVEVIKTYLA